jgi:TetR/AcrR family transcriptional repressor of nem operon
MARASHKEKILTVGMQVVHAHGFAGASVRDIVQAAGVPQGSFTNHFASKEIFGLEVIDLYFANALNVIDETLMNDHLPPLRRLRAYIDAGMDRLNKNSMRDGCLLGNFVAEASSWSEPIRKRLNEIFAKIQQSLGYCLHAAVRAGELDNQLDCEEMAAFIVSSLQGANLLAKAEQTPAPVERFRNMLFSTILPRVKPLLPLGQ